MQSEASAPRKSPRLPLPCLRYIRGWDSVLGHTNDASRFSIAPPTAGFIRPRCCSERDAEITSKWQGAREGRRAGYYCLFVYALLLRILPVSVKLGELVAEIPSQDRSGRLRSEVRRQLGVLPSSGVKWGRHCTCGGKVCARKRLATRRGFHQRKHAYVRAVRDVYRDAKSS